MALTQQRLIVKAVYNQETDPTPISELSLYVDHPSWSDARQLIGFLVQPENNTLLGGNLVTSSGWTSTGWTGSNTIGWTHTAGNTTALSNVLAAIIDSYYRIELTVTNRTAGSFTVAFGGDSTSALIAGQAYTILATTNNNLVITPTSDFDGTILIAIKEVVWQLTEQEILDILGKPSIYSQAEVDAAFVAKETGKGLISTTEVSRLANVTQGIYTLHLNASSDVATRLVGLTEGVDYPTGWTLAADSGVNLLITHTLTGRNIVDVKVFEKDGTEETWVKEGEDAYSGFKGNTGTVLIEGLDTAAVGLRIALIFD